MGQFGFETMEHHGTFGSTLPGQLRCPPNCDTDTEEEQSKRITKEDHMSLYPAKNSKVVVSFKVQFIWMTTDHTSTVQFVSSK